MTVTGTEISIPKVRLFFMSSTMIMWVIPTLYPAKLCNLGSPVASGQALNRGMWLFALVRGLNAREPRFGRCVFPIFLLRKFQLKYQPLRSAQLSDKRKMHWIPQTLPGGEGRLSDLPGRKASSRPEHLTPGTLIPSGICKYPILF